MRKVSHLIGAEMIHNLYDRHWPYINSLRFRNTVTNFNNGIVESFAPIAEWEYLQNWLSLKFLSLDPVLLREINTILSPKYEFIDEIMAEIEPQKLRNLTNQQLALALIDIMDFALGDIYKLNVVQIEYSLNLALETIALKYEPEIDDCRELLSEIISPGKLTVAQKEEVAFAKIIFYGKKRNVKDPTKNLRIMKLIHKHQAEFGFVHCAYGEEPFGIVDYTQKYIQDFSSETLPTILAAKNKVVAQQRKSMLILERINDPRLSQLCKLMSEIGVFRDTNKAKLGETVVKRLMILDEISNRTSISRDDINFYLVSELVTLIENGKAVPSEDISIRRTNGVNFVRKSTVNSGMKTIRNSKKLNVKDHLKGICASAGVVKGRAKIITSKSDFRKLRKGEIMIAIGTDFDLLDIMYKAGGIITEEGGLLSHASVVCRELEKPCIIAVAGATEIIRDGDEVILDANEGKVLILNRVLF